MYDAWTEAIKGRSKGALGALANPPPQQQKNKKEDKKSRMKEKKHELMNILFLLVTEVVPKRAHQDQLDSSFSCLWYNFLDSCLLLLPPSYRRILNLPLGTSESLVRVTDMVYGTKGKCYSLEGYHLFIQMRCKM